MGFFSGKDDWVILVDYDNTIAINKDCLWNTFVREDFVDFVRKCVNLFPKVTFAVCTARDSEQLLNVVRSALQVKSRALEDSGELYLALAFRVMSENVSNNKICCDFYLDDLSVGTPCKRLHDYNYPVVDFDACFNMISKKYKEFKEDGRF